MIALKGQHLETVRYQLTGIQWHWEGMPRCSLRNSF